MDVTLTRNQQIALNKFLGALCGDEPSRLDHSKRAQDTRNVRKNAREFLHQFAALSMRIGAERVRANLGLDHMEGAIPKWKDPKNGSERTINVPDGEDKVIIK